MSLTLPDLITALSFLAAFSSVLAVGLPLLIRSQRGSRLKAVAAQRETLSQSRLAGFNTRARLQPHRHEGLVKALLARLKLSAWLDDRNLRRRLAQAGWRGPSTMLNYLFARLACPVGFLALSLLYVTGVFADKPGLVKLAMVVGATWFGAVLPAILLTNAIQKRQQVLTRAFPDALDLMVICVEAGLSIEAAFARVTAEMADSSPEMSEEIGLTGAELAFLADRRQAFENFADRTGLAAVKSLTTTLLQAEKYGTPVSVGLRVLSQENRDARLTAAEKKAAALPAKLTVPMILFFLPVLFLVIAGPAGIQVAGMMK
jgi:tight adherence protein C